MEKSAKAWLIAAAILVLIGALIFLGVMAMLKWDFQKLSTVKYETSETLLTENFRDITIVADTADISFVPSETAKVVCHEQKDMKHTVSVTDDALSVELIDTRKWYHYIGISFDTPKISVYLPQDIYGTLSVVSSTGDVEIPNDFKFEGIDIKLSTGRVVERASVSGNMKIETSTGDILVEGASAIDMELVVTTGHVTVSDVICKGDIQIEVDTGRATTTDVSCRNLTSSGDTGDIRLKNTIAEGKFAIERDTGDVIFEHSDAAEIFVETTTGNVKGSLLTEKVFLAQTDTGRVDVPKTMAGGRCEIITNTGDIKITLG